MKRTISKTATGFAALALAACGGGGEATDESAVTEEVVDAMLPGEYEIVSQVTQLNATEGEEPATRRNMDEERTYRVCVGEDGILPPETFGEEADNCSIDGNPYFRRGKVRQALTCKRDGYEGQLNVQVDAEFTAEGIEGQIRSATFFTGPGDYQMVRQITGTRVGDCTQAEVEEELEGLEGVE